MPILEYLPDWRVTEAVVTEDECRVAAVYLPEPGACPKCRVEGLLYRHGSKDVTFTETPVRGRRTRIDVKRSRYRCRACGATSMQPLPDMDETRRMTGRCRAYIAEQAAIRPNTGVADDVGVDEKIVRKIARDALTASAGPVGMSSGKRRGRVSGTDRSKTALSMCWSCRGLFGEADMELDHADHSAVPGDVRRLCRQCNRIKAPGWFGGSMPT